MPLVLFVLLVTLLPLTRSLATLLTKKCTIYYYASSATFYYTLGTLDPAGFMYGTFSYPSDLSSPAETEGWSRLVITSNPTSNLTGSEFHSDATIGKYAGVLEGLLTADDIYEMYHNFYGYVTHGLPNSTLPEFVYEFVDQNDAWMQEKIRTETGDPYWEMIGALRSQYAGLVEGYNIIMAGTGKTLTHRQLLTVLTPYELKDLLHLHPSFRPDFDAMSLEELVAYAASNSRCSGMIAVNNGDLFVGHTTWECPCTINRIFKEYNFHFSFSRKDNKDSPGPKSVQFSSYPGSLTSQDDLYTTSAGLVTLETTDNVWIASLWDRLGPGCVLAWMRVSAANWLSSDATTWSQVVALENSGTYNNQWIAVDLKLFHPGSPIQKGTVVIAEQMPGTVFLMDVSDVLQSQGYFPSYNVPYSRQIYDDSGYPEILKKKPQLTPLIDYHKCVRATLFKRDHAKWVNMDKFRAMLEYNDYKNDPLELANPSYAVAARYDLDETRNVCHMGTDGKAVSFSSWDVEKETFEWSLRLGPTRGGHSDVPAYSWDTTVKCDLDWISHLGQPTTFDHFEWFSLKTGGM